MCGRFTLRSPASIIAEEFSLLVDLPLSPRFNIAPSQPVAVVRPTPGQAAPQRQCVLLHWGLVPSWAADAAIGNRLINARAETAAEKPAFRAAMRRRRCLIVADGFYEWQRDGRRRQPYFIAMRDDRPFGFAGLWEAWEGPDHSALESCTILTVDANELVRPIHDRMPLVIDRGDYDRWLDPAIGDPGVLQPLLRPYPSDRMMARAVGTWVNSPGNDGPRCIEEMTNDQ